MSGLPVSSSCCSASMSSGQDPAVSHLTSHEGVRLMRVWPSVRVPMYYRGVCGHISCITIQNYWGSQGSRNRGDHGPPWKLTEGPGPSSLQSYLFLLLPPDRGTPGAFMEHWVDHFTTSCPRNKMFQGDCSCSIQVVPTPLVEISCTHFLSSDGPISAFWTFMASWLHVK